jgi:hypothetical protein
MYVAAAEKTTDQSRPCAMERSDTSGTTTSAGTTGW